VGPVQLRKSLWKSVVIENGALHLYLENVRRLELKLGQVPANAFTFTAAVRNEVAARDPVVGNISLHLFISEHTVQERNHLFHGFEYRVRERTRSSL
jgi:hypothetical protein